MEDAFVLEKKSPKINLTIHLEVLFCKSSFPAAMMENRIVPRTRLFMTNHFFSKNLMFSYVMGENFFLTEVLFDNVLLVSSIQHRDSTTLYVMFCPPR